MAWSTRKAVVDRYFDGFRRTDHDLILSCLTDDVRWEMPGVIDSHGKAEFDAEIEHDAAAGHPTLVVDRLIEEDDAVVAVGRGSAELRDGTRLEFVFCDVFTFDGDLVKRVETYLVNV
jgi:ketosteroid isomerase-like protein